MGPKKILNIPGQYYYTWLQAEPNSRLCSNHVDFLKALESISSISSGKHSLAAYVLLPDSWHLIIRSGGNLGVSLDGLFSKYRKLVEGHADLMPHHFAEPVLLEPSLFLPNAVKLLHWLPVTKGQVASMDIYPWSSHHQYAGSDQQAWLEIDEIIDQMANHRAKRHRRYLQYISAGPSLDLSDLQKGNIDGYMALASQKYLDFIQKTDSQDAEIKPSSALKTKDVIDFVCHEYKCAEQDITGNVHHRFNAKLQATVVWLANEFEIASYNEVAIYLGVDPDILQYNLRGYSRQSPQMLDNLKKRFQLISNTPSLKKASS